MDDEFGRIVSMITRKQARRGAQVRAAGLCRGVAYIGATTGGQLLCVLGSAYIGDYSG
jgi:hypothetical protein